MPFVSSLESFLVLGRNKESGSGTWVKLSSGRSSSYDVARFRSNYSVVVVSTTDGGAGTACDSSALLRYKFFKLTSVWDMIRR